MKHTPDAGKSIKRYLEQKCIGYRRDAHGSITHSIYWSLVEYTDGSTGGVQDEHPVNERKLSIEETPQ